MRYFKACLQQPVQCGVVNFCVMATVDWNASEYDAVDRCPCEGPQEALFVVQRAAISRLHNEDAISVVRGEGRARNGVIE